jgi:hypothetical protein
MKFCKGTYLNLLAFLAISVARIVKIVSAMLPSPIEREFLSLVLTRILLVCTMFGRRECEKCTHYVCLFTLVCSFAWFWRMRL